MLAGSLAVANGANDIRADLYHLRFGTCVVGIFLMVSVHCYIVNFV